MKTMLYVKIVNGNIAGVFGLFSDGIHCLSGNILHKASMSPYLKEKLLSGQLIKELERDGSYGLEVTDNDLMSMIGNQFNINRVRNILKELLPSELWL